MLPLRVKWLWVILFPLASLWAIFSSGRRKIFSTLSCYRSRLKVVCVGNIHSGGSGKTPLVKCIAEHFSKRGAVVLARGYGGKLSASGAQVDASIKEGAFLFGDESFMLARQLTVPVFIDKNRVRGIKTIEKKLTEGIVVLDDGFQHLSLCRDLNLVCINADKKIEDNFCLPLGELRESISAISKCNAVVLTPGFEGGRIGLWHQWVKTQFPQVPIFSAELQFEGFYQGETPWIFVPETPFFSFCGIASPGRFVASVNQVNPNTSHLRSFRDHHQYKIEDVDALTRQAGDVSGAVFVTTDKDWYKVAPLFELRNKTLVSLRMGYKMSEDFWPWLESSLGVKDL